MRIIINGIMGRMGRETEKLLKANDIEVTGADINAPDGSGIYKKISECPADACCVIDFSHHSAAAGVCGFCAENGIPLVEATTGHTEDETEYITELSKKVAVLKTGNLSIGIALMTKLISEAASFLPQADVEIVETHHNKKLDAPSGTALMLAKSVQDVRESSVIKQGRSGICPRTSGEIGISSVRLGNVVGRHEVMFGWQGQTLTITHEALDRSLFAEGALACARFLQGRPAGLYDMNDVVSQKQ